MGRKKRDETSSEKPFFGSGAELSPEPKDDGLVRCVCTVPCAWRGYHGEGDRVWIDRKLVEGDPFFKGHFKPLEPLLEGRRRQDGEGGGNSEGAQSQLTEHDKDADGSSGNGNAENKDESAGGEDGQGELGLN